MRKTGKIRLTETAQADLTEIWCYLAAESSESVAAKFLFRLERRFNQIMKLPWSGAPRAQLASGLRVVFCEPYAIYYIPKIDGVVIVRVLHGARDIDSIADEGGFGF